MAVKLPVSYCKQQLFRWMNGTASSFFIYGPLVFSVATEDFLQGEVSGDNGIGVYNWLSFQGSPLVTRRGLGPRFGDEELVIVPSPLFPSKFAEGYGNPVGCVVESINGTQVKNLRHLVALLRDCKDDFVVITFADRYSESLVLPRAEMGAETERILNENGIRKQGSADALEVWEAAAARK
jgi:hypothetical protein